MGGYSWISPSSWKKSTLNNFKRLSGNPPTDTNGLSFSLFGRKTQIPGLGFPATPYTRTSFEAALNEMFGLTETSEIHFNGCLAGAVAREFNQDINNSDVLQLFDSKSDAQLVTEVLLGSSNAPIYFNIPSAIGLRKYIDGGVGGNCPLAQAMPRTKELWPDSKVKSVLSLAPPPENPSGKIEDQKAQILKTKLMVSYMIHGLTDGEAVFKNVKAQNPDVLFMRCRPTSEKSASFAMDENEPKKMIEAMEKELSENPKYFNHILDSAAVIASRSVKTYSLDHLQMFEDLVISMKKRRQFPEAIHLAETVLDHISKKGIFTT